MRTRTRGESDHAIDTSTNGHSEADLRIVVRAQIQTMNLLWGLERADGVKPVLDLRTHRQMQRLPGATNVARRAFAKRSVHTSDRKEITEQRTGRVRGQSISSIRWVLGGKGIKEERRGRHHSPIRCAAARRMKETSRFQSPCSVYRRGYQMQIPQIPQIPERLQMPKDSSHSHHPM